MKRVTLLRMMSIPLILFALVGTASAQGGGTTLASGFNGPQGVLVASDGSIWVADSGVGGENILPVKEGDPLKWGDTARVIKIGADGAQTVVASLPSLQTPEDFVGAARLAVLNGKVYVTSSGWNEIADSARLTGFAAIMNVGNGTAAEVANTWDFEEINDPAGGEVDSHPYGIAAGADGNLYVVDAGGNTLLRVNPATGKVTQVAVFPPLPNNSGNGPPVYESVPTGVVPNADGSFYVSYLPGFPFTPGTSKVVKVMANGDVSDYATGLNMTTDLRKGPDGNLYAVQLAMFGQQGPAPNSGALIRIKPGAASEVVLGGLSFPTSVDFNRAGDAFITINGVGAPGSGAVVKYNAIAPPPPPAEIPEPATLLMVGAGLAGLAAYARKRRAVTA